MKNALLIDIGSTFTKVTAVDIENKTILGTAKSFTTINTNIVEGYENALVNLKKQIGDVSFDKKLASSSAAGGLKMISVGLVPSLTSKVARLAATSAGAKVIKSLSYELTQKEADYIESSKPDIILLTGGIDGGNKDVIIKNAKTIAKIEDEFAIIVAGNKCATDEVEQILQDSGKQVIVVENVMPNFNEINILPTKKAIRELFINQIIDAKGLNDMQSIVDDEIIPTPLAVFEACENLSSIGELVVVDVGGATTDVYSMTDGNATMPNVVERGLKEPYAKRTVEGDLGVRYSLESFVDETIIKQISENLNIKVEEVSSWIETCNTKPETVPSDEKQLAIDSELAAFCVDEALKRHSGKLESVFTPLGEVFAQTGKNLMNVKYMLGTGGSIINSKNPKKIVERGLYNIAESNILKPNSPTILIDEKYILSSMGLLGRVSKNVALEIMKKMYIER